MNEYQQQILDHYKNPRNFVKTRDELTWEPTHQKKLQNLSCGDMIEVFLKVNEEGEIEEVAFRGEGCSIAIASASLLLEELKGKKLEEVKEFNLENLLEIIGIDLTISRTKCANLSLEAVKDALESISN